MEHVVSPFMKYAAAIFAVSFLAGWIPLLRRWSAKEHQFLISLSAGIILGVVFFDLLPEAMGTTRHFTTAVLVGFVLLLILEKFVLLHPHETEELADRRMGFTAYVGISLHAFLDGIALGSSVMLPALGPVVFWAIVAHKVPETFSVSSILLYFGFPRRHVLLLLMVLALVTPLGGVLALLLLRDASPTLLGQAIGVAAGMFLFIATSDLLPHAHAHHEGRFRNLLAVILGLVVSAVIHQSHHH